MKTEKITGIKSVDFKIVALGHGVVNWNGSTRLTTIVEGKDKTFDNHTLPKLRGFNSINGYWDEEKTKPKYKYTNDIDFENTPLYISQNCIRHHLFKENSLIDIQSKEVVDNLDKLLCSMVGLVRGYVIPKTENKRTSALLLEDFVDTLHNGNFEQMGKSGTKEKKETKSGGAKSTSHFSKTTFGDTRYESYGSISIEQLQFISLDSKFSRQAVTYSTVKERKKLADQMTSFLNQLGNTRNAKAEYHDNYVRNGAIYDIGEAGVVLNEAAIDIIINKTLELFTNLIIRQAKGYMYVDTIEVDYNDGSSARDMMRIKRDMDCVKGKETNYAQYFTGI